METYETPPTWKKFPIISLVQNKILRIVVFCNYAYFLCIFTFSYLLCAHSMLFGIWVHLLFFSVLLFCFCTSLICFWNYFYFLLLSFNFFYIAKNILTTRFHMYIFFTMFCVHSFFAFVFLFIMLIWCPTVVSQHLVKKW